MKSGNADSIKGVIILAAAFAAFFLLARIVGSGTLCWFRTVTGLPCPGCGLTSAAGALFRWEVAESLKYHLFLLPVAGVFVVFLLRRKVRFLERLHSSRFFYPAFIGLFVLYFAIRVILYFPNGPYPMVYSKSSVIYTVFEWVSRLF